MIISIEEFQDRLVYLTSTASSSLSLEILEDGNRFAVLKELRNIETAARLCAEHLEKAIEHGD